MSWGRRTVLVVVYYESLKRELKTKTIYGYRCDERLKTNVEESTRLDCPCIGYLRDSNDTGQKKKSNDTGQKKVHIDCV